jgi:hypothetical protein
LHRIGELTIWLTLTFCLLHLLPALFTAINFPLIFGNTITFLCGFLPAFGAAMAGINHQGEFGRFAKSSMAMTDSFLQFTEEMDRITSDLDVLTKHKTITAFQKIKTLSHDIANLMINELSDWKVVFQERPPVLPA